MNDTKKHTDETRRYYWMVAGNVVILDESENVQAIPANAMIITDDKQLGEHQLGKAQQALQVSLFRKLGEPAKVVDVILINIIMLGFFTDAEFHAKPAGVEVQERSSNVVDFTSQMN